MANHSSNPAARTHEKYEKAKRYDTSKRCYFLGKKAMTNLDSVLKSRDIILLTKVRIVKAMVFPVTMYACESWTIKKAECGKIDAVDCDAGEDS